MLAAVARSTPEAEATAMAAAMFSRAVNAQTFLQHLLGFNCKTVYHQDNEALLKILAAGYSPKLRHCGRVHRVNIASMSEELDKDRVEANYCHTNSQIANGLTKGIPPNEWPAMFSYVSEPSHL